MGKIYRSLLTYEDQSVVYFWLGSAQSGVRSAAFGVFEQLGLNDHFLLPCLWSSTNLKFKNDEVCNSMIFLISVAWRGSHRFTCHPHTYHTLQPQDVAALWLVLIAPTHEGMARLSWPGWLVTYRNRSCALRKGNREPGHGHPSQY